MVAGRKVAPVDDSSFDASVLRSSLPVLVDFGGPACGPCVAMRPTLAQLAEIYEGRLRIVDVNVEEAVETAMAYGVRSLPTLMLFKGGSPSDMIVGATTKAKIVALIEKALS